MPKATLYRMVMDKHVCPYGLKAKDLLRRQGFSIEDKWLTSREARFESRFFPTGCPEIVLTPRLRV